MKITISVDLTDKELVELPNYIDLGDLFALLKYWTRPVIVPDSAPPSPPSAPPAGR